MPQRENSQTQPDTEKRLKDLFSRGLAGDDRAYHTFLSELGKRLRAYLRNRLRGLPDEVEDLVQEVLIAVHNQRHTYDPALPLTAWVHAIAKFKLVDLLRRRSRRELLTDPLDDAPEVFCDSDAQAMQARRDVAKLLDLLPDRQRLTIVYVKLEGRSVAETAGMTGMSESAIKIGVHRGLKALAARIRNQS